MGNIIWPSRFAVGGGGGSPIRASNLQYVNNSAGIFATLPTGSQLGDDLILFAGHGWPASTPSGFSVLDNTTGGNVNGATFKKTLDATDISNGTIHATFSNIYFGAVGLVTLVGTMAVRTNTPGRNSTGASTRNLSTDSSPQVGDTALWFSFGRANITVTCNAGSQRDTTSNGEASAVLNAQTISSGGVNSATFSYSGVPTGDYESVVVLH